MNRWTDYFFLLVALLISGAGKAGEIFKHPDKILGGTVYNLRQNDTIVKVNPSYGSNVLSISAQGIEYVFSYHNEYWQKEYPGGVSVLYPTPNRIKNGQFTFDHQTYQFTPNFGNHHIHGLVLDAEWDVVSTSTDDNSATIKTAISFKEGSLLFEQFPFEHQLLLTIKVQENSVRWTYEVDNSAGSKILPFGFGLHPYFLYQDERQETFVTLPVSHKMADEGVFPTGELIAGEALEFPLGRPFSLQGQDFDTAFLGVNPSQPAVIEFRKKRREINLSASESFSHLVVWASELPVFSLENQTSSVDAHNLHSAGNVEEASLQLCPPGQTCTGWVEYKFKDQDAVDFDAELPTFELVAQHCESCHGLYFTGGRTPSLWVKNWRHTSSPEELFKAIKNGIPSAGMPAFGEILTGQQIEELVFLMTKLLKDYPRGVTNIALENTHVRPRRSQRAVFRLEPVVDGLTIPWSMAFISKRQILVTERQGTLRIVESGALSAPIAGVPPVHVRQDGGLLAIALHPDHKTNGWIYLALADPGQKPGTSMTKIVRGRIKDLAWVDEQTIWQVPPSYYSESNSHYGTRLVFDGNYLYFSVGERGQAASAQDLSSPLGKIHRILADGTIPDDNPFRQEAEAFPSVWSYGHRNPQGLVFSPTGDLWSAEHGPVGGDELNLIRAGGNYGWPLVSHGTATVGGPIPKHRSLPTMLDPIAVWQHGIAPANIAYYQATRFPGWQKSLLVGSLNSQELRRLQIVDGQVVEQELLLKMLGRIRDVQIGPDGYPYLALERFDDGGIIVRLVPAELASPATRE